MSDYRKPEVRSDLRFLYRSALGRIFLKIATRPWLSNLAGRYLDSRFSRRHIKGFIKKNNIDTAEVEEKEYRSFNDYFTRTLKAGSRPVETDPAAFVSPADSLLSVFPITKEATFTVKNAPYTVASLLQNEELASRFEGGWCCIFRLTVSDYHRYAFFDGGTGEASVKIPGRYHTVNPIAEEKFRIYKENTRAWTLLHTDSFGDAVQIEVGALLVGRIVNHEKTSFVRGEEKGFFQYGGSTVIVLLQKDKAVFDEELLRKSREGWEKKVRLGEKVGERA